MKTVDKRRNGSVAASPQARSRSSADPHARHDLAAALLTLQQTRGNSYVQQWARSATLTETCSCGGSSSAASPCAACRAGSARGDRNELETLTTTRSLFDVDEGTETATATQAVDGGTATVSGCSVTGRFDKIPSGTLTARLSGSKLTATFDMVGKFAPSIPCHCSCGEYRQYVRGYFKKNGTAVTHRLCANTLDPTTYYEDCATIGGTDYKYGYRSIRFATSKFTDPDQATGCTFEGYDAPGITGASGDSLEVNLEFKGELIDTCNGTSLASSRWKVAGTATVP